jgi:D-aminopeptidase
VRAAVSSVQRLIGAHIDVLFTATVQATEEAITNAMIAAETMTGADYWRSYAIPHDQLLLVLRKHNKRRVERHRPIAGLPSVSHGRVTA